MVRSKYTVDRLKNECPDFIELAGTSDSLDVVRERLFRRVTRYQFDMFDEHQEPYVKNIVRVRDCTRAMRSILRAQSDRMAGFSVTTALFDIAHGRPRPDLQPGFFADLIHIIMGMQGRGPGAAPSDAFPIITLTGRPAAEARSRSLDRIWKNVEKWTSRYEHGCFPQAVLRRKKRKSKILSVMGATENNWNDWRWHVKNVIKEMELLEKLVPLTDDEKESINAAMHAKLPFGVTPYYLHLMDENLIGGDRAIRSQVFPPPNYVREMAPFRGRRECAFDFMLEQDTSPIDLVTRRYPAIAIFKPFNTCPQICVYCQRNWEIDTAMAPDALASPEQIDRALDWIAEHPAIHELLITGGDPLALSDSIMNRILSRVSKIKSIEHVRIGSRTLITIPMRITEELIDILNKYHRPGICDLSIVTHVEHPYEVTPEVAEAVRRIKSVGIPIYNQQVYTFFTSRRFESALLRRVLRKIGIEPYYIFNTKGKSETKDYIVPIARLLQEINEEARLLPGLTRTDEAVYNVPGLGKNYLRARHHRDLVSILPDGSRVYEFHPWDQTLTGSKNFVAVDVPILDYLNRLKSIGENISDYETIWYYF